MDDTRNLRQKVNKRTEKEWDKPTLLLITAINVSKAPTSMPTGAKYFALPGPSNWPRYYPLTVIDLRNVRTRYAKRPQC